MAHGQDFFQKSLSKATFERKLSSVSLPLDSPVILTADFHFRLHEEQ